MQNFAEKMASLPSQGRVAKPIPCAYREQADPASPGNWQEGPPHVHPYCSTSHALAYRCSILDSSFLLLRASQYCKNSDTTEKRKPLGSSGTSVSQLQIWLHEHANSRMQLIHMYEFMYM